MLVNKFKCFCLKIFNKKRKFMLLFLYLFIYLFIYLCIHLLYKSCKIMSRKKYLYICICISVYLYMCNNLIGRIIFRATNVQHNSWLKVKEQELRLDNQGQKYFFKIAWRWISLSDVWAIHLKAKTNKVHYLNGILLVRCSLILCHYFLIIRYRQFNKWIEAISSLIQLKIWNVIMVWFNWKIINVHLPMN
jgi:hypothetical protein